MTSNFIKIVLVLALLISCGQKEEEAIPLSDILPGSEMYKDGKDTSQSMVATDTLIEFKSSLRSCALDFKEIINMEESALPDRFNSVNRWKLGLVRSSDTLKYYRWDYKDSLQTVNAFFNWIDCFGKKCTSAYVGEEKNFQKNAMQLLVSNSSIIYIEAKEKLDFEAWIACHDSLGMSKWNYIIEQKQRNKAKWYKFTDNQKTKIQTTIP